MPEDPSGVGEGTIFEMQHDALNDELRGQLSLYTLGLLEAEAASPEPALPAARPVLAVQS